MTVDLQRLTAIAGQLADRNQPARPRREWYRIDNQGPATSVYIYDDIGGDGIRSKAFVADLAGIRAQQFDLHINSGGGSVFEGTAIYAALKNHPATITGYVDGIAGSIASVIAMACDRLVMEKPAKLMIHDAAAGGMYIEGNAETFRTAREDVDKMADLLDHLSNTIAEIYADRAGGSIEDWRARMRAETWYSSADAVTAGLADQVRGAEPHIQEPTNTAPGFAWDPGVFLRAVAEAVT